MIRRWISCADEGETLLITSQWRSRMALLAINLKSGRVQDAGSADASWSLLGAGTGEHPALACMPVPITLVRIVVLVAAENVVH